MACLLGFWPWAGYMAVQTRGMGSGQLGCCRRQLGEEEREGEEKKRRLCQRGGGGLTDGLGQPAVKGTGCSPGLVARRWSGNAACR
jgi:hypothetical protein